MIIVSKLAAALGAETRGSAGLVQAQPDAAAPLPALENKHSFLVMAPQWPCLLGDLGRGVICQETFIVGVFSGVVQKMLVHVGGGCSCTSLRGREAH